MSTTVGTVSDGVTVLHFINIAFDNLNFEANQLYNFQKIFTIPTHYVFV